MKKYIFLLMGCVFLTQVAFAQNCPRYSTMESTSQVKAQRNLQVLQVVAKSLSYSLDEVCQHPAIADIFFDEKVLYNEKNEAELHDWVTLHYNEHSCQYFVRKADFRITSRNCYNTW